jgi:hypothetical protein
MTCAICFELITPGQPINEHHEVYKCRGGKTTTTVHKNCHIKLHSTRGDFREFGRIGGQISALSRQWAFNLKNVRNDPAHEINRAFYRAMYAH